MHALINRGAPFPRREAADVGLNKRQFTEAVHARTVRQVCRGIWVDARVADSRNLRLDALSMVRPPDAIACNETAAWLYGVDTFTPGERHRLTPSFVVPHATTRLERPDVLCRQAIIPARDLAVIDGVCVTNPTRTTSDLLRGLYRPYALAAGDGFARAGLIDVDEVIDYVHALKGYRHIVQARSLSLLIDARAESPGESWHRLRIHDAGFPPPVLQFPVTDRFGRLRRLDHAYPDLLIGSEYDGREFHTHQLDVEYDLERREDLTFTSGWRWVNADRGRIFGPDPAFELELGELLGITPLLPRRWGSR